MLLTLVLSKKFKGLIVAEMAKVWGVPIQEAGEFSRQHNIQSINLKIVRKDSKKI